MLRFGNYKKDRYSQGRGEAMSDDLSLLWYETVKCLGPSFKEFGSMVVLSVCLSGWLMRYSPSKSEGQPYI